MSFKPLFQFGTDEELERYRPGSTRLDEERQTAEDVDGKLGGALLSLAYKSEWKVHESQSFTGTKANSPGPPRPATCLPSSPRGQRGFLLPLDSPFDPEQRRLREHRDQRFLGDLNNNSNRPKSAQGPPKIRYSLRSSRSVTARLAETSVEQASTSRRSETSPGQAGTSRRVEASLGQVAASRGVEAPTPTETPAGVPTGASSGVPSETATGASTGVPAGATTGVLAEVPTLALKAPALAPAGASTGASTGVPTGSPDGAPTRVPEAGNVWSGDEVPVVGGSSLGVTSSAPADGDEKTGGESGSGSGTGRLRFP